MKLLRFWHACGNTGGDGAGLLQASRDTGGILTAGAVPLLHSASQRVPCPGCGVVPEH